MLQILGHIANQNYLAIIDLEVVNPRGAYLVFGIIFTENCIKMKTIRLIRGRIPRAPLDPPPLSQDGFYSKVRVIWGSNQEFHRS